MVGAESDARARLGSDDEDADCWRYLQKSYSWLVSFQISPTQPTAKLSPAFALVRVLRIWIFCYMLGHTIPVGQVSECVTGVEQFVYGIEFQRPDQLEPYPDQPGTPFTLDRVATVDDAVLFSRALVAALLPQHSYQGGRDHNTYVLRVHQLVNSLVIAQRRVYPTNCSYAGSEFRQLYPECFQTLPEFETETDHVHGMAWSDRAHGYVAHLPLDRRVALDKVESLMAMKVWDLATREMSVGFAFHNAPGHFTGFCVVQFSISPYGLVSHSIETEFLRLHPYAKEVDGGHLASSQLLFFVTLIIVIAEIVYVARSQPSIRWSLAYLLRPWALYDAVHLVMTFWIMWLWYDYIMDPARNRYDPKSAGFQDVAVLAHLFTDLVLITSFALFLSVIRMVEYLICLHPELSKIYRVLSKAISDLGIFLTIFVTMFGGFVVSGYFMFGQSVAVFSDAEVAAYNLLLWFLALGGGMRVLFDQPGGPFFLILFLMICMVLLFNMFTAIILKALDSKDEISYDPTHRALNHRVADCIADRLGWPEFTSPRHIIAVPETQEEREKQAEEREKLLP